MHHCDKAGVLEDVTIRSEQQQGVALYLDI